MALNNTPKVVGYETWGSNTTTWDTETRTWDEMASVYNNSARRTNLISNSPKATTTQIPAGTAIGLLLALTYATSVGGSSFNNTPKP